MRIAALTLERYGAFSDRVLEFPDGEALVIVHGANEAGKTTALQAVADLLYGIEPRSAYGYLHGLPAMRLSGRVVARDGNVLDFRRVKRNSKTLVDVRNDVPLGDGVLEPFLGGRARGAFLDLFGLDRERLRAGGRRLLERGGDLADGLVAAAPGLGAVLAMRDAFASEAAEAHNHERKAAGTALMKAMSAREAARKAIRELEVRADDVERLRREAEEAERARQAAVEARATARMEVARIERLQRVAVEIAALDSVVERRAALGSLPDFGRRDIADARDIAARVAEARTAEGRCRSELSIAERALAAVTVDGAALAAGAAIVELDDLRAVTAAALLQLPKRRDELSADLGKMAMLAAALDMEGPDAVGEALPGPAAMARAERLIDALVASDKEGEEISAQRRRLHDARRRIDAEIARVGHAPDPGALRDKLERLDGCEERAEAARQARRAAAEAARDLDADVVRCRFGVSDVGGLAGLRMPSLEKATACREALVRAAERAERAGTACRAQAEEVARLEARAAAIKAPGEVPTAAAIEASRASRERAWASLRPVVEGARAAMPDDIATAAVLEERTREADRLADDRWAGSARAAELLQAEVAIAEARVRSAATKAALEEAATARGAAKAASEAAWSDCGVVPTDDDADVLERLRSAHAALDRRQGLVALRTEEEARVGASDEDGRRVLSLAAEIGLDPETATVARLRSAVGDMDGRFRQRRDAERDLRNNDEAWADLADREAAHSAGLVALGFERGEVSDLLNVRREASAEEAKAALRGWREAAALIPAMAQSRRRVDRIEEDARGFVEAASALVAEVAPDLVGADAFVAARRLRERAEEARRAETREEEAKRNVAGRRAVHEASAADLEGCLARMANLVERLGVAAEEGVAPLLDILSEAEGLDREVAAARIRLGEALEGGQEKDARPEVGARDPVEFVGMKSMAEAKAADADASLQARVEEDVLARGRLSEIEARRGAASAAQDEADACAAVARAAETFVRSHAAARLLAVAVERYRDRHQAPLVKLAGEAFAEVTDGRWEGLGVDWGGEAPVLKPKRGGKLEDVKALSEGTADALFLAMRVAAIEEHSATSAPLPFVADDIFATFDETRTEAALRLLARLARTTQTIAFTHHQYVVDRARLALGSGVEIVSL